MVGGRRAHGVCRSENGEVAAVFRRWIGKGRNFRGHLFLPVDKVLDLVAPDYYGRPMATVGPMKVIIDRRLDRNWCFSFFDLD